ncbi:MAG: RNA methyltransferase [Burkholderiales bacterium]|nr:RNA methyltransferase [Burkholderiales bacterium]
MRIDEVREQLRGYGAREPHVVHLLRQWLESRPLGSGGRKPADFLPLRLREALPALQRSLDDIARVSSSHPARDGSTRLLMALADGQSVETVLLPREGVCVSTQVGCAVGCVFCMTGREGLMRQVGSAEIVAQVIAARARQPVRKVVFMGMGEPAHNLDNVLEAIDLLGTLGGIGHKSLVFSTVGDARVFERLPALRVRPALALSLHTTRADLRETLLPRAPRIAPDELVAQAQAYARTTGYPVQYQWTLIDGINDGDDEVEGIARLLAGQYAVMNLIPYNAVEGLGYARPSNQRAVTMVRMLRERGVLATLRQSAGQDVDAGCGQLRARTIPIVAA